MTSEEALDRAEAEAEPLCGQCAAHFLDGRVAVGSKRRKNGFAAGFDALRPAVAAKRLGTRVPLSRSRARQRLTLAALTPNRSAAWRCVAPA